MDLNTIKDSIIEYCPYITPRKGQKEAIPQITKLLNDNVPFIFVNAPTGSGKSGIARAFADYYGACGGQSFISMTTIDLQNQYRKESFEYNDYDLHFEKIIGRSHFKCNLLSDDNNEVTCDSGLCQSVNWKEAKKEKNESILNLFRIHNSSGKEDYCWNSCEYRLALEQFKKCHVGICNYDVLLSDSVYAHTYVPRRLLICDEAHNILDKLREFSKLTINLNTINNRLSYSIGKENHPFDIQSLLNYKYGQYIFKGKDDWLNIPDFLNFYFFTEYKNSILVNFKGDVKKAAPVITRIQKFLKNLDDKKHRIINNINNYVFEDFEDNNGDVVSCSFTPLKINRKTSDLIFQKGLQVILMSATFTNIDNIARLLDLNRDEYRVIVIPDERNLKKINPCYFHKVGSMSSSKRDETLPKLCIRANEIMDYPQNKENKGVIHVPSYGVGEYLIENMDNPRLIFHKNKYDKNRVLNEFKYSDEPLVLVSPTSFEGVDFKYDLCRFQMLTCLPVPVPTAFQKRLNTESPLEARMMIANKVVQMLGRGCRSSDDYCENHLLDSRFISTCRYSTNDLLKPIDLPEPIRDCFKGTKPWKYYNQENML